MRKGVTIIGLHYSFRADHCGAVLGQDQILAALRRKGVSNAQIGRAIGKPSSRIAEMFDGRRKLQLAEAVKLVEDFELETRPVPDTPTADVLYPLLDAILLRAERTREMEITARSLAGALEYGLGLIARNPAIRTNPAALATAAQAAADRLPSQAPAT